MEPEPKRPLSSDIIKVLAALGVYAFTAVWWTSALSSRVEHTEQAIVAIQQFDLQAANAQNQVSERLARLEEMVHDERETEHRIEEMLQGIVRRGK